MCNICSYPLKSQLFTDTDIDIGAPLPTIGNVLHDITEIILNILYIANSANSHL